MSEPYVPEGFQTVIPYLVVSSAQEVIDLLVQALDGEVTEKMELPDGRIMHASVKIGNSQIMMGEAGGEWPAVPGSTYIYLPDVDSAYARALEAGATSVKEPTDEFYGDRVAYVRDTQGNTWYLATHKKQVPREELERLAVEKAACGTD